MSEENTQAEAAPSAERPEWVSEKFWDGEKGAPRVEELAKSYNDLERLIGSRVGDLGAEARRKLAEAIPDTLKSTWAEEHKAALAADEAFLSPLEEAWKAKHLPAAPDAYELPQREGIEFDAEHPLLTAATELAKKHGLPQAAFADVVEMVMQARAEVEPPDVAGWKSAIPDIEPRAKAVYNRILGVSPDHAETLFNQVRDPNAFLALEAIVKAASPKPLALEPSQAEPQITHERLKEMQNDPRYWKARDPDFVAKVEKGYQKLYGDVL